MHIAIILQEQLQLPWEQATGIAKEMNTGEREQVAAAHANQNPYAMIQAIASLRFRQALITSTAEATRISSNLHRIKNAINESDVA